jgi:biotin transport system substrate-specific component
MARAATQVLSSQDGVSYWVQQAALVVGASLFVALCAHLTVPLPFTPIPLTLQNFGVLLVGVSLGSKRGFAALALYLAEGASGMPVFNPLGPGGVAQLLGLTGGFLLAYPLVAFIAGYVAEHGKQTFARVATGCFLAEIVLFASGIGWLAIHTHSVSQAMKFGFYWFIFAEVIKIMMAAGAATGWHRVGKAQA